MAKAADWLREERRKVLGDWVAFCLGCGAARRWFEEFEAEIPDKCPQCGGELLRRCRFGQRVGQDCCCNLQRRTSTGSL